MRRVWVTVGALAAVVGVSSLVASFWLPGGPSVRRLLPKLPLVGDEESVVTPPPRALATVWVADFKGNRLVGLGGDGSVKWEQSMVSPPLPPRSYHTHIEYVTVAPNGNLIVSDGEGMMVQELDRAAHRLVWQYGVKDVQGYAPGFLHQPDKAYKLNDTEVVINDGNNRRVIVVDQSRNEIVWQYGETRRIGSGPGLLRGNTSVVPLNGGAQFLITDTLDKKLMIVDRATKRIIWEWRRPEAQWLQHAAPLPDGSGFVMEDRQRHEVLAVGRDGVVRWVLATLADGSALRYPTDVAVMDDGHVVIAEAGRGRVIEVDPRTRTVVGQWPRLGFVTAVAVDYEPVGARL